MPGQQHTRDVPDGITLDGPTARCERCTWTLECAPAGAHEWAAAIGAHARFHQPFPTTFAEMARGFEPLRKPLPRV